MPPSFYERCMRGACVHKIFFGVNSTITVQVKYQKWKCNAMLVKFKNNFVISFLLWIKKSCNALFNNKNFMIIFIKLLHLSAYKSNKSNKFYKLYKLYKLSSFTSYTSYQVFTSITSFTSFRRTSLASVELILDHFFCGARWVKERSSFWN